MFTEFSISAGVGILSCLYGFFEPRETFLYKFTACHLILLAILQYYVSSVEPSHPKSETEPDKSSDSETDESDENSETPSKWGTRNLSFVILLIITVGTMTRASTIALKGPELGLKELKPILHKAPPKVEPKPPPTTLELAEEAFYRDEFSVVITVDRPQLQLDNLFRTMDRFCTDCHRVKFLLMTLEEQKPQLKYLKDRYRFLKHFQIKSLIDVYPKLANQSLMFNELNQTVGFNDTDFMVKKSADTLISLQRLTGCTYLNTKYCWILDYKSFMFQPLSIRTLATEYFQDPYIVFAVESRLQYPPLKRTLEILGYREFYGWPLEEYVWFMDMKILRRLQEIFEILYDSIWKMEKDMLIEVFYFAYLMHNIHKFPHYRILDSSYIYGPYYDEAKTLVGELGPVEDMRLVLLRNPYLVYPVAERWVGYGLTFFRPTDGGLYGNLYTSSRFLDLATTAKMCVGSQPQEMVDDAMIGRWVDRPELFFKQKIGKSCSTARWTPGRASFC
ncbi:hypothetical protein HDU97_007196 [Phlyctochytrium planicorne]|nr:hypothetical protein HDU97_007196 [Phlyctochytrium planicorne]